MNVFGGNSSFTFGAPLTTGIILKLVLKTKNAVWVVSNCNTPSTREKYVKEMQKNNKRRYFW
jgi:hypothetical protein